MTNLRNKIVIRLFSKTSALVSWSQFHIFRVMLLFRKHLLEQGEAGKEVINILNLYHELTGYQAISGAQAQKKKDIQAHQIYKSVITPVGVFIKYIF